MTAAGVPSDGRALSRGLGWHFDVVIVGLALFAAEALAQLAGAGLIPGTTAVGSVVILCITLPVVVFGVWVRGFSRRGLITRGGVFTTRERSPIDRAGLSVINTVAKWRMRPSRRYRLSPFRASREPCRQRRIIARVGRPQRPRASRCRRLAPARQDDDDDLDRGAAP